MQEQPTIYLETGSTDPRYNLAFEETVLTSRLTGDILMLWQNDNAIIIGRNQNAAAEINSNFVEEHDIRVVRRTTGGGAVYHDLGNLNYSFITDIGNADRMLLSRFARPVVRALNRLGLDASLSGRNDITIDGKKVSGTAQRIHKGRLLFHGTLLFDSDPDMIAGALNASPEKFTDKAARSVRARVGNIRGMLKTDMTLEEFRESIKETLTENGIMEDSLTPDELKAVEILKQEKYDTREWNFGSSPKYDYTNRKRFEGGSIEVRASIKEGVIGDIVFYGDFLATSDMTPLLEDLKNTPFFKRDISEKLEKHPLDAFFGTIKKDEILSLF